MRRHAPLGLTAVLPIHASVRRWTIGARDSLGIVEISMELQKQFDIMISDGFEERVRAVGEVANGVMQVLTGPSMR